VQFNDDHRLQQGAAEVRELVKKYYGKPINFVLHRNSELGLGEGLLPYMNQASRRLRIVSPPHVDFSKRRRSSTRHPVP